MDSTHSLPNFMLDMNIKISHVECHPEEVLVKFCGKYNAECEFDYHILQTEIQCVPKIKDSIGVGEFCLVEDKIFGEWHRGRILDKKEDLYKVFFIDNGKVLTVNAIQVASACGELFQLPPRIVYGIFASILPLDETWTPKALNYFSSLVGWQVEGHVQAVLPYQTVLLEVPKITSHVIELKLGKYIDGDSFRLIVEMSKELPENLISEIPSSLKWKSNRRDTSLRANEILSRFQLVIDDLQPCLSVGTTERVKITAALSPKRFYCQKLAWMQELQDLTSAMSLQYEAVCKVNKPQCESFGTLCAARQKDGQWHRGVIEQLFGDQVKVWFMDFGNSETVSSNYVYKLEPQFLLVPMMSFPCALSSLSSQNEEIRNSQLKELKRALLGQTISAHIDLFSPKEHVFNVTLHTEDLNTDDKLQLTNQLLPVFSPNGHAQMCNAMTKLATSENHISYKSASETKKLDGDHPTENDFLKIPCQTVEMKIDSVHVAYVEYVLNPSNFWIRTDVHEHEFLTMMNNISELYNAYSMNDQILENPKCGLLCCARYTKDSHYYRAVVTEVLDSSITVYFLDFGNTDTIPFFDVKILLPQFSELPALAMCCTLAHAFPVEDIWIKNATDFFKMTVFAKELLVHVLAKQNDKYVVDVHLTETSEKCNVVALMVQAGFAEYWPLKSGYCPPNLDLKSSQIDPQVPDLKSKETNSKKNKFICIGKLVSAKGNAHQTNSSESTVTLSKENTAAPPSWEHKPLERIPAMTGYAVCTYKQHIFKPGTVLDVVCSNIISPGDFWCQLDNKLAELKILMREIQNYYRVSNEPYQPGQTACIAKYVKDGKWYRASILQQVSKKEVEVMFVDYGYKINVLVTDLQAITSNFLLFEGQAFRCSLYNLIEPIDPGHLNWTRQACRDFRSFINNAASGSLKCNIYALVLESHKRLCNIVNLETPFVRVDQFLIDHGHAKPGFSTQLASSVCLHSFYYSSFNLKIGNEEEVHITHICNPGSFFCQLSKNSEILDKLMIKIAEIGNKMKEQKWEGSRLSVCIAKYFEDENFYRALAYPIESSSYVMVDFVDFGNKQMVEQHDLLPIPEDATEVFFTPIQAIKCCLSDFNEREFPVTVNKWFEKNCLGKTLKAVLISRNIDGQLAVELYDGCLQINAKIKDLLQVCVVDEQSRNKDNKSVPKLKSHQKTKSIIEDTNMESHVSKAEDKSQVNELHRTNDDRVLKNKKELVLDIQEMISQPLSVSKNENVISINTGLNKKMGSHEVTDWDTSLDSLLHLDSHGHEYVVESTTKYCTPKINNIEQEDDWTIPKYTDLPRPNIQQNSKHKGYVSHVNSPLCFYFHLAADENLIVQLAEELNKMTVYAVQNFSDLTTGDLLLAEYALDLALYRAVIKEVKSVSSFDVEFIDYGNSSIVNMSQIFKIQRKFLTIPRFAIHCCLSGVNSVKCNGTWNKEITSYFMEKVNGKPVMCEFLQLHNEQWKVNIISNEKSLGDELMLYQQTLELKKILLVTEQSNLINHTNLEQQEILQKSSKDELLKTSVEYNCCNNAWYIETNNRVPCQRLKPGQLEKVRLLNVLDCGDFHVIFPRSSKQSTHLTLLITKAVKSKDNLLAAEHIKEGMQCLTKSENKMEWLRSEVKQIYKDEKKMLVFFMDYGTTEKVSISNVKMLSGDIKDIPKQTVACKWIFTENVGKMSFNNIMNSFTNQEIKILFQSYLKTVCIWKVEIIIDGKLFMQYLNDTNCEDKSLCRKDMLPFQMIPWAELDSYKQYCVFAATVINPSNFYIQLKDSLDILETLSMLLCGLPENLPSLPKEFILIGSHCLIKYIPEDQWYRAEISELSDQTVLLTLMDLGRTLCIPYYNINTLKMIPENLACLPRLVYCCSLNGVIPATGKQWTKEAILFFLENLTKDNLIFQFKEYSPEVYLEVDLMNGQTKLADQLIDAGYALHAKRSTAWLDAGDSTNISDKNYKGLKETGNKHFLGHSVLEYGCVERKQLAYEKRRNLPSLSVSRKLIGKPSRVSDVQLKKEISSYNTTGNAKDALNFKVEGGVKYKDAVGPCKSTEQIAKKW
ncbi:tudor domain-containing protein 15 [Rhinatrema bivittatum]|uniref:tudor domain-containing protein 15 n=1 Tax=Rhinatrema bivittatum TaxID=194408 RepID=UPI00112DCFEA|nr:tudor domain-containing protein 15 [Rhinatrema bivittatum]